MSRNTLIKATVSMSAIRPPLSSIASKVVLGGAAFSNQIHPKPESLPVQDIINHALKSGFRTFDTSPYYGPSEKLMGDAFSHPDVTSRYNRSEIILMTKVGRIAALEFDYSPKWVRFSVNRSLERFGTSYLDVVFCRKLLGKPKFYFIFKKKCVVMTALGKKENIYTPRTPLDRNNEPRILTTTVD